MLRINLPNKNDINAWVLPSLGDTKAFVKEKTGHDYPRCNCTSCMVASYSYAMYHYLYKV